VISNSDPDTHAAVAIGLRRYAAYRNRHARQKKQ